MSKSGRKTDYIHVSQNCSSITRKCDNINTYLYSKFSQFMHLPFTPFPFTLTQFVAINAPFMWIHRSFKHHSPPPPPICSVAAVSPIRLLSALLWWTHILFCFILMIWRVSFQQVILLCLKNLHLLPSRAKEGEDYGTWLPICIFHLKLLFVPFAHFAFCTQPAMECRHNGERSLYQSWCLVLFLMNLSNAIHKLKKKSHS